MLEVRSLSSESPERQKVIAKWKQMFELGFVVPYAHPLKSVTQKRAALELVRSSHWQALALFAEILQNPDLDSATEEEKFKNASSHMREATLHIPLRLCNNNFNKARRLSWSYRFTVYPIKMFSNLHDGDSPSELRARLSHFEESIDRIKDKTTTSYSEGVKDMKTLLLLNDEISTFREELRGYINTAWGNYGIIIGIIGVILAYLAIAHPLKIVPFHKLTP